MNIYEAEKEIEKIKEIEDLFELWQKAHMCEDEISCNETLPKGEQIIDKIKTGKYITIPRDSFIKDGYISRDGKNNFNGILFILKEANVLNYGAGRENAFKCKPYRGEQFGFYRDYIENKIENKIVDIKSNQKEKMGRIAYYIENKKNNKKDIEIIKENNNYKDSLNRTAFMNLNKRGGANKTDDGCLYSYIKKYKKFIEKQIDLINPKIIICIGTYRYLKSIGIINEYNEKKYFDMWHTAYPMPRKKDESGKIIKNNRNRTYGLKNANVDLYIEEFVKRYNSKNKLLC